MSGFAMFRPREALGEAQRVIAWAGLAASLIAPALALAPVPGPVAFVGLVLFACVAPGAACVSHVRLGDPVAAWAVVLVLSMALSVLAAVVLAWAQWWQPVVGLLIVATASAASCAMSLAQQQGPDPDLPDGSPGGYGGAEPGPASAVQSHTTLLPRIGGEPADALTRRRPSPRPRTADDSAHRADTPTAADQAAPVSTAGGPQSSALSDATALFPIVGGQVSAAMSEATAMYPVISSRIPQPDETTVIARIPGPAADETSLIPRIGADRPPRTDETTVIQRIDADRLPASDQTTVIPRIGAADETGLIRLDGPTFQLPPMPPQQRAAGLTAPERVGRRRKEAGVAALTLAAGAALWVFSLLTARMDQVDDYGLLSAMHPAYFVAVAVCVLGFVTEVSRRRPSAWSATGHTVLLLLIMHATVPILVAEPEYAWTYKHLGVIDLIAVGRPLDNPYDVYQQWPAFFALVAQLTVAAGVSALRVAEWAPLFFGLANLLPMYAIARTLSTDRRVPHVAVFVFSAVNWVAQDYLAPQAFVYPMCLGVLLVMLRWLRRDPTASRDRLPWLGWLSRLGAWVQTGMGPVPYTSSRARKLSLATLYLVYAAIVVSHQLSPYLIAISAAALVVFRLVQAVQIVPIFGVIAVLQVVPRYRLVESWGLFDGFNLFANAQPLAPIQGTVSPGRTFSVLLVQVLALTIWLLAVLVVVANRKKLGPLAVAAALAAGPFTVLLGNSYGGEAVFRVFLFSSPWCAYLITVGLLRLRLSTRLGIGLAAPALIAATLIAVQGEHGQLMVNRFEPGEIRAAQHLYANVPAGSAVVMAGANFPDRLTAGYTDVLGAVGATDTLLPAGDGQGAVELGDAMNEADLDAINSYFDQYTMPVFLVLSRSQANAAQYFGYYPPSRLDKMRELLDGSPKWTRWHSDGPTYIYRYIPGPAAP